MSCLKYEHDALPQQSHQAKSPHSFQSKLQTLKDILWKSAANSLSGNLPPNANT